MGQMWFTSDLHFGHDKEFAYGPRGFQSVEENDKTIEYLNSLPITRNKIIINKVLVGLIYIILMVLILGIFNFVCLSSILHSSI